MSDRLAVGCFSGPLVIVWDVNEGQRLWRLGYFGKPSGIRKPKGDDFNVPLELDLFEALYLVEKQFLVIKDSESDKNLSNEELHRIASEYHVGFEQQYTVYCDLRQKKYIVRPGLKFGADFAVYEKGPGIDHSPFVVEVLSSEIQPIHLVRAGRLATSVRKKYVIAAVLKTKEVRYYVFSWFKP